MLDTHPTRTEAVRTSLRVLKLRRETLRDLDTGVTGPVDTRKCYTQFKCTRACAAPARCAGG